MAKLSMPVNRVEDSGNKITPVIVENSGGGAFTPFRYDDYYPSIQTAIDIAHPVGSIMCMSSNTNPSTLYGGTWELVDKGLKTRWHDFSTEGGWTASNATLTTFGDIPIGSGARIGGNTMSIRLHLLTTTALSDSTIKLGAINPTSLGLTQLPNDWKYVPFSFDGGGVLDVVGTTCLAADGWLTVEDIWTATANGASHAYASGSNLAFIYHYSGIPHTYMLDSACDKFYFKRTA